MHVPGHVCAMYVATCGQNGPALGSDEKEIILLVYVIIDAATTKIVGVQQYLVRPIGKEQTSQTNLSSTSTTESSSPVNSLQIINSNNNNNSITINNNNTNNENNNNNNNINNNNNNNNNNTIIINQQSTTIIDGIPVQNTELPIDIAQVAGKPLNEVIDQFDAYIRSLSIDPNSTNFRLVTDGQLPIRQCLHPEACAKDIDLPSYYCRFSDLRKEFVRYKSADLSRALVPVKDIKKLTQMPTLPPIPHSIAEMVKELDITTYDDPEFYIKESRDMVSVIQALLAAGHKFEANEIVSLNLEPGICSIDDEIDGSCIVRARGLPWQSSDQDIAKFFRGLNVAKGGVALCLSAQGRRNGEALVRFVSQEHRDLALKRHKHHIGNRYIEVYRATGEDFLAVAGGASNEAQAFLSKGAQVIIRMRGLPYDCTAKQVLDFFTNGDDPCHVLDGPDGVLFVKKPDGRATGDAFVLFASESDAPKALSRHRESIGQRYIELFRSTTAEVQQVLNRSLSIEHKVVELPAPPLLPAPIPTAVPMQLLPQHVITSGSTKNCIRLRGLPYEARVEHILHFLDDFAKNIIYQGVHMIYNAQGQPSGEAFIQMDSEEAARLSAQQKHNQFMVFGKKYRYIEVFQCSGDDINLVINGGMQSPVNATKPALLSPGGTLVGHPFGGFASFGPPTTILPSPHRAHPAFYPQPFVYWGYPSPPVSPTTYFGPAAPPPPPPTHIAASNLTAQHQAATLFPVDYLHPTYQQSPASPSQHHHHHHQHQHHHHHHQSVVVPSTVVTSSPPSNHLHVSPASPATVALHHRHHHQQQHNSQQQQSHHLHHNHNQQHHQPCLHSAYSQSLHQYQSATTAGALVPSPPLHHSPPTFHPSATSATAIQSSSAQPQLTIQSTQSTLPPLPAVPSGTISVTPTAIAAAAAATAAAVSATTISMAPATIPSIPLQASPTNNSYPATQHLLTIDTTNIPSPTISIPYDKLLTPRVLTPTATTTFALAAAAAAAVGPPTFALPTSPVTIPGPAVVANPCVELYIA